MITVTEESEIAQDLGAVPPVRLVGVHRSQPVAQAPAQPVQATAEPLPDVPPRRPTPRARS
jgi:hypothetical protein